MRNLTRVAAQSYGSPGAPPWDAVAASLEDAHLVYAARGARAEQRVVQPDAALADRPIDELVQFIQGAPGTGMSRSARKRAARAKRTET